MMPDTARYYHIAYAAAATLYTLYGLTLWRRSRRVRRRLSQLRGDGR